jgi:cell division protein FtsZ
MCFITAGMGGGTGTGAAPIIAQAARELGVLTVGVVTKPFQFEGAKRMRQAEEGVETLQKMVDTLIIIPNQNLFRLANEKTTFTEAFSMADDVLYQGVKGVTDLMVRPGLINLDFADVRAVMDEMGKAMMGTGEAEGEDRAIQAAEKAIANPLLDEISLKGAKGVLINITGGSDLTLFELDEAANRIREEVDQDANIIVGSTMDESLGGMMRVSVVATGIDAAENTADMPVPRRSLKTPLRQEAAPAPAAAPAPTQQPVAAQAPAPAPQAQQPVQEPLFGNHHFETERAAASEQMEDIFEDEAQTPAAPTAREDDDGLPPPAYQPRMSDFRPQADSIEADPNDFVAPRPAAHHQAAPAQPGQPSAETLGRLKAAAARARDEQPMAPQMREPAEDKPRFSVNSLIGRMTGHGEAASAQPRRAAPPMHGQRGAPNHAPMAPAPEADPEDDRIEIPAFLRRQAN